MDKTVVDKVVRAFRGRHGAMSRTSDRIEADLERALSVLPDRGQWAIASGSTAAVFARVDRTLFTVAFDKAKQRILLISRAVDVDDLVVRLELDEPDPMRGEIRWRGTKWLFCQGSNKALRLTIDGLYSLSRDGEEECDQNETFARELAQLAGWTLEAPQPRVTAGR